MMDIRRLDRSGLVHENGLHAQRLLPWQTLNAPFQASWCVLRPGDASMPHAHLEYEIFVAVSGRAVLESDGDRVEFSEGDVVYFPPGIAHSVVNEGVEDFQMYSIWWDAVMTERFAERHREER